MTYLRRLLIWLGLLLPPCGHLWRPCKTDEGLARVCSICDEVQQLSQGEFYAYFGLIPR